MQNVFKTIHQNDRIVSQLHALLSVSRGFIQSKYSIANQFPLTLALTIKHFSDKKSQKQHFFHKRPSFWLKLFSIHALVPSSPSSLNVASFPWGLKKRGNTACKYTGKLSWEKNIGKNISFHVLQIYVLNKGKIPDMKVAFLIKLVRNREWKGKKVSRARTPK